MGFRWPGGVNTCAELEAFLDSHGDGITEVPEDRWSKGRFYSADKTAPGKTYVHRGGFLQHDVFSLDPGPFTLSPRECQQIDPQQRILLEVAWDALDDAGLAVDSLKGTSTGVYVGGFMLDSRDLLGFVSNRKLIEGQTATGMGNTVLSNRISYTFDLRGPSMTVDTACSSSLVTLHLACRDLISGTCSVAMAGGVNVMLSPLSTLIMCKGQFLAADGRSKAFDAAADGYGRGEGAGLVVLKRLEDAERDGDRIYAVILATGVNQDGRTDGMPLPNGEAQVALSRQVSERAGVDPRRLGYIEAHGTGTKAGDTTEIAALAEVYGGALREVNLCVGSIKTNIGHTEAAAGIAGVIKAALSLYRNKVFPLRALNQPNPAIDFAGAKIEIPLTTRDWPAGTDQTAAVNSFGYGGTNAHAVLASLDYCAGAARSAANTENNTVASTAANTSGQPRSSVPPLKTPESRRYYIPLSAADDAALKTRATQLAACAHSSIEGLASTLAHHRSRLPHRAVVLAKDAAAAADAMRRFGEGQESESVVRDRADVTKLCCVYTGMGPQWWGMGRDLLETEPVFRRAAEEVDALFTKVAGWSLLAAMTAEERSSQMAENRVAQPANFLLQVALTQLLWSKGVRFAGYLGHSVGELTATWASGCLTLEEATIAAFHRSDLQQKVAGKGTMLAASLSLEEAEEICRNGTDVSVAAINGAKSVALAGSRAELEAIAAKLEEQQVFARMMRVEVAYHSHHMDPLQAQFLERLAYLQPQTPSAPLISTVFGDEVTTAVHDASYFWKNARQPVLLQAALHKALAAGYDGFMEVGPHPVLAGAIFAGAREVSAPAKCIASLNRSESQTLAFDRCLAALHCAGVELDWDTLAPRTSRLELPAYPFQRKHYWQESPEARDFRLGRPNAHPFLDQKVAGTKLHFRTELDATRFPWLSGHEIQGATVFPGAGYLEVGLAMCHELGLKDIVLNDVQFQQALVLPTSGAACLNVELSGEELVLGAEVDGSTSVNATMRIPRRAPYGSPAPLDLIAVAVGMQEVDVAACYEAMKKAGLAYSGDFRALERVWHGPSGTLAQIRAPQATGYYLYPATLDAAFQSLLTAQRLEKALVPVRARCVNWFGRPSGDKLFALSTKVAGQEGTFDVRLYDASGAPLATVDGLVCAAIDKSDELRAAELDWLHEELWPEVELAVATGLGPLALAFEDSDFTRGVRATLQVAGVQSVEAILPLASPAHVVFASGVEADLLATGAAQRLIDQCLALPAGSRLTVLTRQARSLGGEVPNPSEAALTGLARVIMTERPHLTLRVIDLAADSIPPEKLCNAIFGAEEEELVLRGSRCFARRLARQTHKDEAKLAERRPMLPGESVELHTAKIGAIDSLVYRPRTFRDDLANHEVEIDVQCSSLNFKDLMKVMGLLGETALERTYLGDKLGIEAAGIATRVGSDVTHVRPGDFVVGFFGGSLATRVRAAGHLTVVASRAMDLPTAASLLVYATAWHGLVDRAALRKGERVLIHAGAGGVGLAAVQIALALGAEVFTTAGNGAKRSYLRSLGIEHVYDSRTLNYATEIRQDTGGRGVDVVLNSLAGEHLRQSLQLLAPGGRFIELGKQDFAENRALGLLPFNRALSFHAVDLDRMSLEAPEFFRPLVERVCQAFEEGLLTTMPSEVFSASDVSNAFRKLNAPDRVGKIVIDFREGVAEVAPGHAEPPLFGRNKTYLVVGGLAGFGLRTAEWLAESGAGTVVLASRRGKPEASDARRLTALAARTGCTLEFRALDVLDLAAVKRLLGDLAASDVPLAGIFHAGAVLDDRALEDIDADSWLRVLGPKALGAWHLHLASQDLSLDHFVLYSSVSSLIGNPGQGAYAAANSFLDAIAQLRHARGLAATSVAWGAIAEVGMLARDEATGGHLKSIGFASLEPGRALKALERALTRGQPLVAILAADWARWQRHTPNTAWRRLSLLDEKQANSEGNALADQLRSLPEAERLPLVLRLVAEAVAPAFKMNVAELEHDKPLRDLGLDSLLAVEVQTRIEELTGIELSSMEILSGRPTSALAGLVKARLEQAGAKQTSTNTAINSANGTATDTATNTAAKRSTPANSFIPGNLRDYFLERICVQPPYFALENVTEQQDGLSAEVVTEGNIDFIPEAFALAEAGRHLAILGSCTARQRLPADAGRIYYPVRHSKLLVASATPLPRVSKLRATCTDYDAKRSTATSHAELLAEDGSVLFAFEVTYHVIPEAEFTTLFAEYQKPTDEASGDDPYTAFALPHALEVGPGFFKGPEEVVAKERCLGHFVNYPAYPVSIMLRDVLAATHRTVQAEHGPQASFVLEGGTCDTTRFVFAGESIRLSVHRTRFAGPREVFRCELTSNGELAAAFELHTKITHSTHQDLPSRTDASVQLA